jgi:small subunit ribosomal protein S2
MLSELFHQGFIQAKVHIGADEDDLDPRMMPFIRSSEKHNSIIDLDKTLAHLENAQKAIRWIINSKGLILFVSQHNQFDDIIEEMAFKLNMPFLNNYNLVDYFEQICINKTIRKKLKYLDELQNSTLWKKFTNFEKNKIAGQILELKKNLIKGIHLDQLPSAIFITDPKLMNKVISDAQKYDLKIISLVNTDSDPLGIDYLIPANNYSISSVELVIRTLFTQIYELPSDNNHSPDVIRESISQTLLIEPQINLKSLSLKQHFSSILDRIILYFKD